MTAETTKEERLGRTLAGAAREGRVLSTPELAAAGLVPETIAEGMAAQAASVVAGGWPVAGWKVAVRPEGVAVAAPLVDIVEAEGPEPVAYRSPLLTAVEVEIAVRLRDDMPARSGTAYSREALMDNIASVHMGIEILSFRLDDGNQGPFPLFLADRIGNGGFVLGPAVDPAVIDAVAGESADLAPIVLRCGSETLFSGPAVHPNGDPLSPVLAYANAQIDGLGGLKAGQVVTTGALCGLVSVPPNCTLHADWISSMEMELSG
ncbi:2-keto-4-pentenoate hydratase [Kaustia mangrovi]|uniref:2-keto-4-pentenoate hydratase n=1 Tax=Kaustia mangrovi TaxID=2593653 RepID=A0A7S8HD46_9HYPH|nr:2-keto-4-pentenoate hydratase [Kaustia mangrovi]QPC44114.1 2-keto-4-pentenoate hydratase [Kaustia mangrovi]